MMEQVKEQAPRIKIFTVPQVNSS